MSKKSTGKGNGGNTAPANTTETPTTTIEPASNPTSAPAQINVPTPAPMATPMIAGTNLPVRVENGRLVLPDMTAEEAAEWERRRLENEQFAAQVKARKEKQIAALRAQFDALPGQFNCPDMDSFKLLFASHLNGTLGMDGASGSLVKTGHNVAPEIRAAVEKDLKAGTPNVIVADRYKVSLPWVSMVKKELGLTKSRNRKK